MKITKSNYCSNLIDDHHTKLLGTNLSSTLTPDVKKLSKIMDMKKIYLNAKIFSFTKEHLCKQCKFMYLKLMIHKKKSKSFIILISKIVVFVNKNRATSWIPPF